jgi:hypothetical protein
MTKYGIKEYLTSKVNFNRDKLDFYFTTDLANSHVYFLSIPEDVGWTSAGDDDDYRFISNKEWVENGTVPEDFTKFSGDEEGKLTTFGELSAWARWILLSYTLGFSTPTGIVDSAATVYQDDGDLRELLGPVLKNEAVTRYTNSPYDANFISGRLLATFKLFNDKLGEEQTLDDIELEYFKIYHPLCKDIDFVKKLRIKITKTTGKSDFIADRFGIEKRFDFNSFAEEAQKLTTEQLARKGTETGKPILYSKYDSDGWYYSPKQGEKIQYSIDAAAKHPNLHNRLLEGSKTGGKEYYVSRERLRESQINDNAVFFDVLEFWDESLNFYELDHKFEDPGSGKLGDVYDPTTEVVDWGFDKTNIATGPDDVTFAYFLKFIDLIRLDIQDNELETSLGSRFTKLATQAKEYILPRLVRVYENKVRTEIARELERWTKAKDPQDLDENNVLNDAENAAIADLANLDTSELAQEDLTDEDISDRETKYKQCVLLLNLPELVADYNKEVMDKKKKKHSMHSDGLYNKRFTMVKDGSNPSDQNGIINKLILPKADKIEPFLNMTNELYAYLSPKIRLYKVFFDPTNEKNPHVTREIPFKAHTTTARAKLLSKGTTFDRGDGFGIKSFNFSFDGETPATSTKFIKAKLELFFQTFSDFTKEREVTIEGDTYKFRYVDLFVNTKFCPRMGANEGANVNSPLHYDPSHYRIRADVGWEFPERGVHGIMNRPSVVNGKKQLEDALNITNKSFYLNLIDHDISISDQGTVTISADYIAYIEGATGTRIMNALNSKEAKEFEQKQLKTYEEALQNESCDEAQLSELRAAIQGARVLSRKKLYQSLTEKLILNDCMYTCFVDKFDRKRFSNNQFFTKKPKLKQIPKVETINDKKTVKKVSNEIPNKSAENVEDKWSYIVSEHMTDPDPSLGTKVNFFFFADLVYFLLDSLYKEKNEFFPEVENIKVILTSFVLNLLGENEELLVNIGQIPIDLETFIDWYKVEILDKEIEAISIIDFIKRFFLYLVKDIFQEVCVNTAQHKRLSFKTMSLMAIDETNPGNDPLYTLVSKQLTEKPEIKTPILNLATYHKEGLLPLRTSSISRKSSSASDFINYMTIFVHYRPDKFTGLGIKSDDETRGVYHFFIGADKGLVKKISFSKSDIQYMRESRMMNQGTNNLLQLSSQYRCNLTMVGNTLLYPGMEIFVNPYGFGGPEFGQPNDGPGTVDVPNLSNIMGIGGYQQVIKVNSTITPGKFETTIDAIFIHSGEKEEETSSSSPRRTIPNNKLKDLCAINDKKADSATTENSTLDCTEIITNVENLLLDYSRTGTIDGDEE